MEKKWQITPKITLDHNLKYANHSWLSLQLLNNRGLTEEKAIAEFFKGDSSVLNDPSAFDNMAEAVSLVIKHIKAGNFIMVYGDYDADGVTAAAVVYETLKTVKAQAGIYLPDRVSEGYGLNMEAVKNFIASGVKLIITVDGGIRNKAEVALARGAGIDVIITDHHVPPEQDDELPDAVLIDPHVKGENYPFKDLAGVGVALKLALGLIRQTTLSGENRELLAAKLEDLVAIGTVADCVPLLGENRVLVKTGLIALNKTKRVGLKKLIAASGINSGKEIDAWNIGFQLAPRLNAAGRLDHANTAFELLVEKNEAQAEALANKLCERNAQRQKITEEIMAAVEKQIDPNDKLIVGLCPDLNGKDIWNEGVIGLVAGRICEKYYRPALVITKSGGEYKGSGRSISELNIVKALDETKEMLSRFGGHAAACGFSLNAADIDAFIARIKSVAAARLEGADLAPKLLIEAELNLEEVTESLIEEVARFAPFGQGNERPRFLSRAVDIVDIMNMGADGQHLKLRIKSNLSPVISAIGFGQSGKWSELKIGDQIDMVYYVEMNEYNGRREAQVKIIDIKAC